MRLFNFSDFTYIFQILIIHLFANVSFLAELNGIDFVFIEFSASMDLIYFFFFFFLQKFSVYIQAPQDCFFCLSDCMVTF